MYMVITLVNPIADEELSRLNWGQWPANKQHSSPQPRRDKTNTKEQPETFEITANSIRLHRRKRNIFQLQFKAVTKADYTDLAKLDV